MEIIEAPLRFHLHGFSGSAPTGNWAETGLRLMNEMWHEVRSRGLKNKGINVWVYEDNHRIFAGVELESPSDNPSPLESKNITLNKYVSFKHVGPYHLIRQSCDQVLAELSQKGITTRWPYLEVYGHWSNDETKLETELLWSLD